MALSRFNLALFIVCAWLTTSALGQQAPVWQPYRVVASAAGNPATHFVIVEDVPQQVVTDLDLDQMCAPCGDPFSGQSVPQYISSPVCTCVPYGDPVLAPFANAPIWDWHLLPDNLIWHSYWAGAKEPRFAATGFQETQDKVSLLDVTLGGRASVVRYGTVNQSRPEGWELQLEGASMLRLNLDENWDMEAVDFRFGVPLIYAQGRSQWKFSYYHLSSHLGDEILIRGDKTLADRINFSRDVLVLAYSLFPVPALRMYGEMGWAFYSDEGTEPWEFQFGIDYAQPGPTGRCGTPFFAVNGHLRQEVNFGGNFVAQGGWLWRGNGAEVLRTGLHYHNGKSNQFEFSDEFEEQVGLGLWYDY
jgi:hypothetical protein